MVNPIPALEWSLYSPLMPIGTMIELGNKRNLLGVYKDYLESQGTRHVSIDMNGKDGALPLDLRELITLEQLGFSEQVDVVTNMGTTEHVNPQLNVWANIVSWIKPNGHLLSATPAPGSWRWHGFSYPTLKWLEQLCELNGFVVELLSVGSESGYNPKDPHHLNIMSARKVANMEYTAPSDSLMYKNK